ncbi:hypothetical protein Vretimale_19557 [Volvox reticuliferus]|uniref:Uncharacterized protein n=1 Tax=Volvox reticuliferus TaxID=1737510 RepID=A0A8J4M0Q6_9CHLO|nr:hypothetical protein Vretifemale_19847 [Volvox reticuliferus]GIM17044.1 hypothetical protein Vretimale_19557 [Volvox reticuliferus]
MQGLSEWLLADAAGNNYAVPRHQDQTLDIVEREVIRRRMRMDKWTLDRGTGYFATERQKKKLPCLVQTGKHAGRSRVRYVGIDFQTFWTHILRRDFFTTAVNAKLAQLVAVLVVWYFLMLLVWSSIYYVVWRWNNTCFIGFHGFRSAFMYATETQQTIGFGERATGECWMSAVLVSIHSLQAVLLDSVILGIVFSRISHPKQRSRTVLISDCACIARRDGQLKLMFRIADIQKRSVIDPRVRVVMYTWGPGRRTAEGEKIPVIAQDMSVSLDCTLLLPVTVEHTIDEASPLYGQTSQSLEALGAEIVVTFEASSELGDTFMARQSYLPSEIHWGHTFVNVIRPAHGGDTQHEVDLSRFHDVEPQPGLGDEMTQPHRLSRKVVSGGGTGSVVPGRLLHENTLVLSEDAVVACRNGRPYLMFRLGDTFPGHVVDVQVSAHLYRWHATNTVEGEMLPYEEHPLLLEPVDLLLRYPVTLLHELDPDRSPVAHWACQRGLRQDADAEVVVVARGTLYSRQEVITRTRVYSVLGDVKWGHAFLPVVMPGSGTAALGTSSKLGAAVDWSHFHATTPITMPVIAELQGTVPSLSPPPSTLGYGAVSMASAAEFAGPGSGQPVLLNPPPVLTGSRLARSIVQPQLTPSLTLPSGERTASASSLSNLVPQPQMLQPATAINAPDAVATAVPQAPVAYLPRPQSMQHLQKLTVPRSSSTLTLRPETTLGFASGGVLLLGPGRRTEDGTAGNSDDFSSMGNTTSYDSGGQQLLPSTGENRQAGGGADTQAGKGPHERTWHSTRSLFAALENIQAYMQEECQRRPHEAGEVEEPDAQPGPEMV